MNNGAKGQEAAIGFESGSTTPLFLGGLLEYNKQRWGLELVNKHYEKMNAKVPFIDVAMFLDGKGKMCLPPWTSYLAIHFKPTATNKSFRLNEQWLELAGRPAKEMRQMGISGSIALPPDVTDARPWQWAGFHVSVKYTYIVDFPFSLDNADSDVRRMVNRAINTGYRCLKVNSMSEVIECLDSTQARRDFDLQLTEENLVLLRRLLGDEHFRVYICYAPNNEAVSAYTAFHIPGSRAIGWLGGTKAEHFKSGATQLTYKTMIEDLQAVGATGLDLAGANISTVAYMKAQWGCKLSPYYVIEDYDIETIKRSLKQWAKNKFFTGNK
jgi:hypothetical protein